MPNHAERAPKAKPRHHVMTARERAARRVMTARERAARGNKPPAPKGRVWGYVRVSTVQQVSEGESLDVQQRTIAGYAQMKGLPLDHVYVERGVSGSKPLADRPQGAALLAAIKPGDVVITPKLDRMFRSALDALDVLAKMKAAGISLHMIDLGGDTTGNGVSKLVFTILSAVAEAERDRTRERITEVKRDQRSRGRYLGGTAPFGWTVGDNGELVPVPEQQRAIEKMKRLRATGLALRAISDKLKASGVSISHQGVKKVLAAAKRRAA
jgi:putative DNA-invertase from lambdoid prophage Rac